MSKRGDVAGVPTVGRLIKTWTGLLVDPTAMRLRDIDIEDIAHALARICRYNGHCDGFISVAQHPIWVSDLLVDQRPRIQLAGLLHDAPEAYLGDMVSPMKKAEDFTAFREADDRLEAVIAEVFGIPNPLPGVVVEADHQAFVNEHLHIDHAGDYREDERAFLARFDRLTQEISCS